MGAKEQFPILCAFPALLPVPQDCGSLPHPPRWILLSPRRRAAKKLWSTSIRKWGNSLPIRRDGPGQALDKGVRGISSRKDPPRRAGRRAAKKLWSARVDFPPRRTLCTFPTLLPVPQDCGSLPRRITGRLHRPPRWILFSFFLIAEPFPPWRTGGNLIKKQMEASVKKEALFYIPSLGILNLSF
jgi:hypothetical protein